MRKVLAIIVLSFLLLNIPGTLILAQEETGPAQCCKIKHNMTIDGNSAGAGDIVKAEGAECSLTGTTHEYSNWAMFCTMDAIYTIADVVNIVAMVASGVVILIAGILFIFAGDSPERLAKAKTFLKWGLIGVAIIILAKFITGIVGFFFGV